MNKRRTAQRVERKGKLKIQLSGFPREEKKLLAAVINKLGALYLPEAGFDARCDVVVIKRPCRSEKYLCGLALGVPVVTPQFIEESSRRNQWLDPLQFIWRTRPPGLTVEDIPDDLLTAPQQSIDRKKTNKKKAFWNWVCAVKVQDVNSTNVYKRILSTGGARVVDLNLDIVTSTRNIPPGLTHLFTETCYENNLQTVARYSVHCVTADYIGDYVIKGWEEPKPHHYIVPYSPVIDLLQDSPADSDSSSVQFISQDSASPDMDSDIELVTSPLPIKKAKLPTSPLAAAKRNRAVIIKSEAGVACKQIKLEPRLYSEEDVLLPETMSIKQEPTSSSSINGIHKRHTKEVSSPNKKQRLDNDMKPNGIDRKASDKVVTNGVTSPVKPLNLANVSAIRNFLSTHLKSASTPNGIQSSSQPAKSSHSSCDIFNGAVSKLNFNASNSQGFTTPSKQSTTVEQPDDLPSTSGLQHQCTPSLSQQSPASSPKKYTKLLKLTPTNTPTKSSQSQSYSDSQASQCSSTVHVTPVKTEPSSLSSGSPFKTPSKSSQQSIKSYSSTKRKSKKPPVMPAGALLKYFTPKAKVKAEPCEPGQVLIPDKLNTINEGKLMSQNGITSDDKLVSVTDDSLLGSDIHPLDESLISETPCRDSKHSIDAKVSNRQSKEDLRRSEKSSCLGILDGLNRLTLEERGDLYTHKLLIEEINKEPVEEKIDLTEDDFAQEMKEIPVLLLKQIEIYFEENYVDEKMNGVELMEACLSERHHPPPRLLKHVYELLLNTSNSVTAHRLHSNLMEKLQTHPPVKRVYEAETATPTKQYRTRRMRHIYMNSLCNRAGVGFQFSYLHYLNIAVQTLVSGGVSEEQESQSFSQTLNSQEEPSMPPLFGCQLEGDSPLCTPHKEGTPQDGPKSTEGSELFIHFICQLLENDYRSAKSYQDCMLHQICKGGYFGVNLVDSKDSKLLLDLTELLVHNKHMESAFKLINIVSLIADMCKPESLESTNHAAATIISRLRDMIKDCDTASAEMILLSVIPDWLAYRVLLSILEDKYSYSSQLVSESEAPSEEKRESLSYLIRNYLYLIPTESTIFTNSESSDEGLSVPVSTQTPQSSVKVKRNHKGETPLHTACIKGDEKKVKDLLNDPRTDVNARDNAGWTPLHEACNHGNLEIVELLLKHQSPTFNADGNGRVDMLAKGGEDEMTPLHDAVNVGHAEVVKLLLKYGGRRLLTALSKFGTPMDIVNNNEIEDMLKTAQQSTPDNSLNESNNLAPDSKVYKSQRCSCDRLAIDRYVSYCLDALSLHLSSFPLSSSDQTIVNSLSYYLQPFLDHISWLNSTQAAQLSDTVLQKLNAVIILSL